LAEAQAEQRQDTRMYLIAWQSPVLGGRLGALHAVDVPMLFGNLGVEGAWMKYLIGDRPDQAAGREAFSHSMQRAWAAFARTGDPSHPGLPEWPAFDLTRRATMVLDTTSAVQDDPMSAIRQVWDLLPFNGVRPAVEELPRIADIKWFFALRALVILFVLGILAAMLVITNYCLE
jgi:para-nitrobenzyl esterase